MDVIEEWVRFYYYEKKFSIFPVKQTNPPSVDNKQPNIPSWRKYITERPTEEEIETWIKEKKFKNIALVLGNVSDNIIAIDLDDEDIVPDLDLNLEKFMKEKGIWVQATGKKGRYHLISKNNDNPGGTMKDNAVHIEYRANGAYIVICPSIHPNGKKYHFLKNMKPKELPELQVYDVKNIFTDMVQRLYKKRGIRKQKTKKTDGKPTPRCIEKVQEGGLKEGMRNDTAFALANWYKNKKNLQPTEIRALMNNWNNRNKPPLKTVELSNIITSALQSDKSTGCNRWKELGFCNIQKKNCSYLSKGKSEDKQMIVEQTMVMNNGNLYEQVYTSMTSFPQYVSMNEGEIEFYDEIEFDNGIKYIPVNDIDAVSSGGVYFPEQPEEYGTMDDLINELDTFIYKYVDISDAFRKFSVYYILFSWVTDNMHTIPYLRVIADFASGKSRFLHTVGRLCYKPTIIAGATTVASIFRSIARWRGTLVLEEYNPEKSNFDEDETKILNCGFERGTPVVRCHKETNKLEYFNVFGPKVISSRQPFKDEALNSRCLTEYLNETSRVDIPIQLPEHFFVEQKKLRNKLLMFRLKHWKDVDPEKVQDIHFPSNISRRLQQGFSSFAILFIHDKKALKSFMDFVKEYNNELVEERSGTFDGLIFNAFCELKKEGYDNVTPKIISDHLASKGVTSKNDKPYGPRTIGKHLKTLGLPTKLKKIQGAALRVIIEDVNIIENLKRKYVVEDEDDDVQTNFFGEGNM